MAESFLYVEAEFETSGVWLVGDPARPGPVRLDTLAISAELRNDLEQWAAKYDRTYDGDAPSPLGFRTEEEQAQFDAEGAQLTQRLADEAPGGLTVVPYGEYAPPFLKPNNH